MACKFVISGFHPICCFINELSRVSKPASCKSFGSIFVITFNCGNFCLAIWAISATDIDSFKDVEIEDSYPISREYQLTSRQGNFNSLKADFDIKIPDFLNKKKETEKEIEKPEKKDQICDIFIVALFHQQI